MNITLTNDFHNTRVTLRMKGLFPTVDQVLRAKKTLCPSHTECTCSGVLGYRGEQDGLVIGENQEYCAGKLIPSIRKSMDQDA